MIVIEQKQVKADARGSARQVARLPTLRLTTSARNDSARPKSVRNFTILKYTGTHALILVVQVLLGLRSTSAVY